MSESLNKSLGDDIWYVNLKHGTIDQYFEQSFWSAGLKSWSKFVFVEPTTVEQVKQQFLWYNSFILIDKKIVFMEQLYKVGCKRIDDLLDTNGVFLNHKLLLNKYQCKISWIQYLSLLDAIPTRWK